MFQRHYNITIKIANVQNVDFNFKKELTLHTYIIYHHRFFLGKSR